MNRVREAQCSSKITTSSKITFINKQEESIVTLLYGIGPKRVENTEQSPLVRKVVRVRIKVRKNSTIDNVTKALPIEYNSVKRAQIFHMFTQ